MNLKPLTPQEENRLRRKVGDLNIFKAMILKSSAQLPNFELCKDIADPKKAVYLVMKYNLYSKGEKTGVSLE